MSSPSEVLPRPLAAVAALAAAVADLADAPLWSCSDEQLMQALAGIDDVERRLDAARLGVLADADARGAAKAVGAASTRAWLRDRLRATGGSAAGQVRLANALASRYALVRAALGSGEMNVDQARVIVRGLDDLPTHLGADAVAAAEAALVGYAAQLDAAALARCVQTLRSALDPDGDADLAEKEARDRDRTWFTIADDHDRGATLSGWVDDPTAALIRAVLSPLTAPKMRPEGTRDLRTAAQRRGEALREVFRRVADAGDVPTEGGQRPHLTVTTTLDALRGQVTQAGGFLDDGTPLSTATLRKLACDAEILPVVLGSRGEPLDVGRASRLFTLAIRRALVVRDGGCIQPGCGKPAAWTQAHHLHHWADGGDTSLANGALGCDRDHDMWHRDGWQIRLGADGHPELQAPGDTHWQPGWRRRTDGTHGPPDDS